METLWGQMKKALWEKWLIEKGDIGLLTLLVTLLALCFILWMWCFRWCWASGIEWLRWFWANKWYWINSPWFGGLIVSLGIGHCATAIFVKSLRCRLGVELPKVWVVEYKQRKRRGIPTFVSKKLPDNPAWLTGILERGFFTIAIAYYGTAGPAVIGGMMAWVIGKMVTHWWGFTPEKESPEQRSTLRLYAVTVLSGTLVSMLFALLGG